LDELHILNMNDHAHREGKALISYYHATLDHRLALFDFATRKVHNLQDGRIKVFVPILAPHAEGFAIFRPVGESMVFFISENGEFLRSGRLTDYEGWDSAFQLFRVSPLSGHEYLATAHSRNYEQLLLLRLDVSARQIRVLHSEPLDFDFLPYWIAVGDQWLKVHPETDQIERIDPTTLRVIAEIRPAKPLIDRRKHSPRRAKRRRYSPYLLLPTINADRVAFYYLDWHDAAGDVLKKPQLKTLIQTANDPPAFELRKALPLATHDGWRLLFRPEYDNHHLTLERE